MGVYENIINSKKKKDEEESLYEKITGEKTSAKDNYEEQKNVLTKAQKEYSKALNEEYKNTGAFDFTLPSRLEQNEFSNKVLSSSKTIQSTHSPFDTKQILEKIKTAQNNVKTLKTTVDEEYNKLKYAKYLKDAEKVGNEKTNLWDKTGGVITRALTDVVSSIGMDKYTYIDENGNKTYLPSYNDLKQQKVSQDYDTKLGKLLGDVAYNSSKILGTTALNSLAPGVGSFAYWQDMFMDNYKNTINQGYDNTKSLAYSSVNTAFEYITGKFLGSATKGLTGGKTSELSNMVSNVTNRIINNPKISSVIGNMGSEAAEEFLQEYLDNASRLLVLGEDIDLTSTDILEDALYSAAVGGLSGGLIGSIDNSSSNNAKNNIKVYTEFKKSLEETKGKTTDVNKVNQIDNLIKKVDNYIKNPFTEKNITNEVEPVLNTLRKQVINPEIQAQQNLEKLTTKQSYNEMITDKYQNINEAIYDYANQIKDNFNTTINIETNKTKIPVDYSQQPQTTIFQKAKEVFSKIGKNVFQNNGDNIYVSNSDIKESIAKTVRNTEQKKLLAEHIEIFSNLDQIIENGTLIAKGNETKGRPEYQNWDYYATPIKINGDNYIVEFDTVLRDNGQKHFRLERIYNLEETIKKQVVPTDKIENQSVNRFVEQPVSIDNNITNSTQSQIAPLPSQYNMQQNENKIPSSKKTKKTVSMPAVKNNSEVIRVQSERIANEINKTGDIDLKERRWVGTSTESDVLKDKVLIKDLDNGKINYVVQSNKKSLEKANEKFDNMGYDKALAHVTDLINSEHLPSATDIVLAQRVLQEAAKKGDIATAQELVMDIAILGTDLGQATQALSMIQRLTPEGQLKMYTKIVQRAKVRGEKAYQTVEITPEMVQTILDAYNKDGTYDQNDLNERVEKFKQSVADQMKTTTAEKINSWRYLAMLGNPKTHIRNMVSNIAMKGTIKYKNTIARTLETILPIQNRTKTFKKSSDTVKEFAKQTANDMKGIITGENKYSEKGSIEAKKQIFKNKTLEKISDFNSNALEYEDWMFSKSAFISTLEEYLTANDITTKEDIQNNLEIVEKAKNYAVQQAEIATFRQYSKLASEINRIERNSKLARLAIEATVPFKKTPINVAKAGVKYSPLGLIKSMSYDAYQLKNGNIEASQFIDNLSQGLAGTSLTILGYALAKAGFLRGTGDDDKEGKYDSQLGRTSYSLNIGGQSFSISWLSPVAMPLLVGSNFYEQLEEGEGWNLDIIADTLAETLDPLSEMSFVSSLTDVLTSYASGSATMIKDIGETAVQNYVLQFFPTLFSQLASTLDDKKRSTKVSNNSTFKFGEETVRKAMYKIPGLRNQLEMATDIWGNEKEQSSNILTRAFESFLAPYSRTKDISTELDSEIKKIYNETGDTKVIPGVPYAYTKYDDTTYRMSASEYTKFKKTYGQTANSCLKQLISSASYKNASAEDKAKMISNVYDYSRAKANEQFFENTDVNYSNKTLDKINSLSSTYGINASTYFTNKSEYDYAYQNPKKYSVIKQITSYDKYVSYKDRIKEITDNTTNDKTETIKYINSLNLSIPQKAMFIKQYYKSFKSYDKQIVNYINSQKLKASEKSEILEQLGFTIKDGRVYY